ncbi:MAG: tetratricopeptide repeat protein [Flavobacteriales bacterium]
MKKIILIALLFVSVAHAQNINRQSVSFKYTRLPMVPINDGSLQYSVDVQMTYLQRSLDSAAWYDQQKKNYLSQMESALDQWNVQRDNAQRAYYTQQSQYETQVNSGNTTAVAPVAPQYFPFTYNVPWPKKPMVLKEINPASVTASVAILGMKQSAGYPVKITLTWEGFEKGVIKEEKTGTGPTTRYKFVIMFRHPVSCKAEFPGKGIVLNERIQNTQEFLYFRTQEFKTKGEFQLWWLDNQEKFWQERQDQAVLANVSGINGFLNDKFGYVEQTRKTDLFTIKSKDFDYSDYQKAFLAAQDGMAAIQYKDKQSTVTTKLQEAAAIYNKALTESDLNNRKARIDKHVTAATYVNLAEVYLWLGDFANAEITISKAENIDIGKYNRECRELKALLADRKVRAQANGQ